MPDRYGGTALEHCSATVLKCYSITASDVAFDNGRSRKRQEQANERRRRRGREFLFLTTEANGVVGPMHPKAIPVLLTAAEE